MIPSWLVDLLQNGCIIALAVACRMLYTEVREQHAAFMELGTLVASSAEVQTRLIKQVSSLELRTRGRTPRGVQ